MPRFVEIRNTSAKTVELKGSTVPDMEVRAYTVPAHGRLFVPNADYLRLTLSNRFGDLPLKVFNPVVSFQRANVRDFGAVGDGVADDTRAIQAAIDAVAYYGGGSVVVPVGVYVVDGVTLHAGVSLEGESRNASILRQSDESGNACVSATGSTCSVSHLSIYGTKGV